MLTQTPITVRKPVFRRAGLATKHLKASLGGISSHASLAKRENAQSW